MHVDKPGRAMRLLNDFFVLLVLLSIINFISITSASSFGCLNQDGEFVDWWVIYKESTGRRYVYLDSGMKEVLGLHSDRLISSPDGPLHRTIESSGYPNQQNDKISLAWNDQPRKGEFWKSPGHAKGFIGMKNSELGVIESFLIQHSMPRFPVIPKSLENGYFDSNLESKAQHFFCISMRDELPVNSQTSENLIIDLKNVTETNVFKILWNYARVIQAGFISQIILDCQKNVFKEILQIIPISGGWSECKKSNRFRKIEDFLKSKYYSTLNSFTITSTGREEDALKLRVFAKAPENKIDLYDDVTSLFSIHHEDYTDKNFGVLKTGNLAQKTAMLMVAQSHADPATLGINQKILVDRSDFFATVHILNSSSVNLPDDDEVCFKKIYSDSEAEVEEESLALDDSVMDEFTIDGGSSSIMNESMIDESNVISSTSSRSNIGKMQFNALLSPIASDSPHFLDMSSKTTGSNSNSKKSNRKKVYNGGRQKLPKLSRTKSNRSSKKLHTLVTFKPLNQPSRNTLLQPSMYRDHSKWSVNMIYGVEGNFPALMCFYDLNRSSKQASRGGGAFCLNSSLTGSSRASMRIWSLFMSFTPKPTDMARFNDAKVIDILSQVISDDEDEYDEREYYEDEATQIDEDEGSTTVSKKRRRQSNDSQSFSMKKSCSCSQGLPKARYLIGGMTSSQNNLEVSIDSFLEDFIVVPCPYKVRSQEASGASRQLMTHSTTIPTKIYLDIKNAVCNYGLDALNEILRKSKLVIRKIESSSSLVDSAFSPPMDAVKFLNDQTMLIKQEGKKAPKDQSDEDQLEDEFTERLIGNI